MRPRTARRTVAATEANQDRNAKPARLKGESAAAKMKFEGNGERDYEFNGKGARSKGGGYDGNSTAKAKACGPSAPRGLDDDDREKDSAN